MTDLDGFMKILKIITSNMTYTEQCFKIAKENGYNNFIGDTSMLYTYAIYQMLLEKDWWMALGRGLGWGITDKCWGCGYDEGATSDTPIWKVKQHRLIDHINEGHSIEYFFKSLIENK